MQKIMIAMIVGALLLAGCSAKQVEDRLDEAGDLVGDGLDKIMDTTSSTGEARKISEEEAIAAALKHAGTTQDKVTGLRTEYEVDDGVGHYDVRFLLDDKEYNYEVSAADGKILSFERDD